MKRSSQNTFLLIPLAAGLAFSQGQEDMQSGQKSEISPKSRVTRCLENLTRTKSYRCVVTKKAKAQVRIAGMNQGTRKDITEVLKDGDLSCWTREDGDEVLATRSGRWVARDRDGDWIPGRTPIGSTWKSLHLPDPGFLGDRLLHLMKWSKWEFQGPESIDEKPVRLYRALLEEDEANHLVRTNAVPASGGLFSSGGMVIFRAIGGGGAGFKPPEPERKIEILLYEDPVKRMPLKLVVNLWAENPGMQGRIVVGGAGALFGGGDEDEEEEEEHEGKKKTKKKPHLALAFDFHPLGDAMTDALDAEARKHLGSR